eukprot:CAMPEP_0171067148 /NCGR_PEP_ID=MMETSP0766_2-20121228/7832_1 /TAXON_ID=439317 /ORGANISM="Gambierdiscus australes, Strain CAWD 149" /LENGTH=102 /DNA_ID=CAMNT_0011523365 /DNA_START=9 /DNA_END=317 /DNA_ORIENTATION=+
MSARKRGGSRLHVLVKQFSMELSPAEKLAGADAVRQPIKGKRPKVLIDTSKPRRVMTVFSGLGYDVHRDVIPEILRYRPGGYVDLANSSYQKRDASSSSSVD